VIFHCIFKDLYKLTQPSDTWHAVYDDHPKDADADDDEDSLEDPYQREAEPKYNLAFDPDSVEIKI
jgi:hypothetical protein